MKENIVVKEKTDSYDLSFDLVIENMTAGLSADGKTVELKDQETGEVQFRIPGSFVFFIRRQYLI